MHTILEIDAIFYQLQRYTYMRVLWLMLLTYYGVLNTTYILHPIYSWMMNETQIVFSIIAFPLHSQNIASLFVTFILFFVPSRLLIIVHTICSILWLLLSLSLLCVVVTRHINLMVSRKSYYSLSCFPTLNGYA